MAGKRRVFGAAFKAKVALAAARGDRTTAQLASQFGIHTSQVTAWKKQLMGQVAELFVDGQQLWRSVKYEEVYLRDYAGGWEAEKSRRWEAICGASASVGPTGRLADSTAIRSSGSGSAATTTTTC